MPTDALNPAQPRVSPRESSCETYRVFRCYKDRYGANFEKENKSKKYIHYGTPQTSDKKAQHPEDRYIINFPKRSETRGQKYSKGLSFGTRGKSDAVSLLTLLAEDRPFHLGGRRRSWRRRRFTRTGTRGLGRENKKKDEGGNGEEVLRDGRGGRKGGSVEVNTRTRRPPCNAGQFPVGFQLCHIAPASSILSSLFSRVFFCRLRFFPFESNEHVIITCFPSLSLSLSLSRFLTSFITVKVCVSAIGGRLLYCCHCRLHPGRILKRTKGLVSWPRSISRRITEGQTSFARTSYQFGDQGTKT